MPRTLRTLYWLSTWPTSCTPTLRVRGPSSSTSITDCSTPNARSAQCNVASVCRKVQPLEALHAALQARRTGKVRVQMCRRGR
jgi:hypothetical protein